MLPTPHRQGQHRTMPWHTAYATARDTLRPLPAEETAVGAAVGRVVATSAYAVTPIPAFDTATMDGYAVAGEGPWTVTGRILAGQTTPVTHLHAGTAVEIATGAAVPDGTDAVLPYEHCHRDGSTVTGTLGARAHVRRLGEDRPVGSVIVPASRALTATAAAAADQTGIETLWTHRPPTVALLITGDEVITAGTPTRGQVRDTFTGLAAAVTARAGGHLHTVGQVADGPVDLHAALATATADVIVVTGSSSAGAADHLRTVLTTHQATWHVDGVACRPGHPQASPNSPTAGGSSASPATHTPASSPHSTSSNHSYALSPDNGQPHSRPCRPLALPA
ncbi:hypothetical protein GCM10010399_41670 [Dactylosporangium fulvum]|uniref:Molybdopterin molybdenumtransferase n=1 Tax=Dactylosporangium fulvum TaxID=53359 RepID=A0ABY5VX44_9ACTN|nr:molybdopterin-binding protein [Dactylosporangium fulvum]UWP82358.1 molybdopterin-binding protein [Dactylosporangium fulvum]